MKYYEIAFTLSPCTQDAQDILSALAGEVGCESFEETPQGLKAYIQQSIHELSALDAAIRELTAAFPLDCAVSYHISEAEDRDWNEQWEQEGFDPIAVRGMQAGGRDIIIHDGRHLPSAISHQPSVLTIEIDAHLAFGTGTHETTRMICATLLDMDLRGSQVLDCGCGTGILGICALKLGAAQCIGYDIDEWSADNTRHNAVINHVDDRLHSLCGDASLLATLSARHPTLPHRFHLVMANINRNILLADMEHFVAVMTDGATLILSGFYEADCPLLLGKAQSLGLSHTATKTDAGWACMVFTRSRQ